MNDKKIVGNLEIVELGDQHLSVQFLFLKNFTKLTKLFIKSKQILRKIESERVTAKAVYFLVHNAFEHSRDFKLKRR